jgi:CRISPR-associated protein Csd1
MGWIQKLYETYEKCAGAPQFATDPLKPLFHTVQQAHVEIVLDGGGAFLRARCIQKKEEKTVVPATEASAGRSGTKAPPHPLCDKIRYCASDYPRFAQGTPSFYSDYHVLLETWCNSVHNNSKAQAVLKYVERGTVVEDLVRVGVLVRSVSGVLLTEWNESGPAPEIFRLLTPKPKTKLKDQGDAFVRWRIEVPGETVTAAWEDQETCSAWIQFCRAGQTERSLCFVTGESVPLAANHPRGIRYGGDGAKLISSNDTDGFTYRGRFRTASEACGVSSEVTQKAHTALHWLIARQGYLDGSREQAFVAWSVGGKRVPSPLKSTAELFMDDVDAPVEAVDLPRYAGDAGQELSLRLKRLVAGYGAKFAPAEEVIVMGLDSASPGRMAITFYRELEGSEFLARIQRWHESHAWLQTYPQKEPFIGAPAPKDIAEAAFGLRADDKRRKGDDKLRKAVVESLVPCIVDGRLVPRNLVEACVRRAANPVSFGIADSGKSRRSPGRVYRPDWEKCLGIACGLFRGNRWEEGYLMSLEKSRTTRDYLFGRLLAIGEHVEQRALHLADETRDTNAAKLMNRFAERPCSTWRNLEIALAPYRTRLRAIRPTVLLRIEKELDEVIGMFKTEDFVSDSKLSGEFLLSYHCERAALWLPNFGKKEAASVPAPEGEN